jgi:hypothetical protein
VRAYSRQDLAHDQRIAMLEVLQIGLATLWPGLRRARAEGQKVPLEQLGLLQMVAAGAKQLRLAETLAAEFPL